MQAERVRFTIAVDEDVHQAFSDLASASGVSLSRCVGDWLRDTSEAAQLTTSKLTEVRRSPQAAFQAFIRDGMVPEIMRVLERSPGAAGGLRGGLPPAGGTAQAIGGSPFVASPPPSNTGGKVPRENPKKPSTKKAGGR